jgi:hypothetical protein
VEFKLTKAIPLPSSSPQPGQVAQNVDTETPSAQIASAPRLSVRPVWRDIDGELFNVAILRYRVDVSCKGCGKDSTYMCEADGPHLFGCSCGAAYRTVKVTDLNPGGDRPAQEAPVAGTVEPPAPPSGPSDVQVNWPGIAKFLGTDVETAKAMRLPPAPAPSALLARLEELRRKAGQS